MTKPTEKQKELRELMQTHNLTYAGVAETLDISIKTVEGWLADPAAASHRSIRRNDLELLSLKLGKKKARK